jgi:hypothetical protein
MLYKGYIFFYPGPSEILILESAMQTIAFVSCIKFRVSRVAFIIFLGAAECSFF